MAQPEFIASFELPDSSTTKRRGAFATQRNAFEDVILDSNIYAEKLMSAGRVSVWRLMSLANDPIDFAHNIVTDAENHPDLGKKFTKRLRMVIVNVEDEDAWFHNIDTPETPQKSVNI